ncbi:Conserved_hypothetical protein [Hexamita inflata]|uniref:Uncharacterized protein n=1 Tax=Hexamita inflata TaxID=28002 RepID=A0AA86Q6U5_9EUKA|nr:Conserved hypothetical protein [Hexamita inflata]
MINLLILKQYSLHNEMILLENDIFARLSENNIFNLLEQQLDDATTVFYDPKLFLYSSSYDNIKWLNQFRINYQLTISQTMSKLNMIINPNNKFPVEQQKEAAAFKNLIINDKSSLQSFFNRQYQFINESFSNYSQFFDEVQSMNIESLKNQKFLSSSKVNIFQFVLNGTKSDNFNLHFTNPIPLQKISKDVIVVLNNFQDAQSVLKTIHESCTVFDRIWFLKIVGEVSFTNIVQDVYERYYLSLQATLNNFQELSTHFQQENYTAKYVDFQMIQKIIVMINQYQESLYNIQHQNNNQQEQEVMKQEAVVFIFGQQNFINTNFDLRQYNAHLFFVYVQNTRFSQNTINMGHVVLIEFVNQIDFLNVQLQMIIRILNNLYVSTRDEISSVNSSVLVSRALYKDKQYIGMLLINEQLFGSFADMTINNLDGLTATTLKVRMMDKQIPILNPYYQFSQTISYRNETPQPLIQTIPGILNDYPQNQFSDIVSAKIVTIQKTVNKSAGSFIEYINEYYYMQVIRNELTIQIGLSSTVITTKSRLIYLNVNYCVPPKQIQFTAEPLDLSHLRYSVQKPFYRTNSECLVSDGYKCMFKTDIDLFRQAKEQISKQINSDNLYLCGINYTSSKFTLNTVMGGGIAFSCLLCEQLYIKIFCHFQCG